MPTIEGFSPDKILENADEVRLPFQHSETDTKRVFKTAKDPTGGNKNIKMKNGVEVDNTNIGKVTESVSELKAKTKDELKQYAFDNYDINLDTNNKKQHMINNFMREML